MKYDKEIILLTIILIILSGLNVYLLQKEPYDCNKCTVSYNNKGFLGEQRSIIGPFIIKELYEELIENKTCKVAYDKTQGYIHNG